MTVRDAPKSPRAGRVRDRVRAPGAGPGQTAGMSSPTYYIVLDLEATCCDDDSIPREETEIIEIGAVLVDAATLTPGLEFQTFVKPLRHRVLTPFCTKLTTITQADVQRWPASSLLHPGALRTRA